jgi:chemotaxis protein MotB
VQPVRIVTAGYGESRPVASNETPDGRARNRRVEIRLQTVTS